MDSEFDQAIALIKDRDNIIRLKDNLLEQMRTRIGLLEGDSEFKDLLIKQLYGQIESLKTAARLSFLEGYNSNTLGSDSETAWEFSRCKNMIDGFKDKINSEDEEKVSE